MICIKKPHRGEALKQFNCQFIYPLNPLQKSQELPAS